MKLHTVLVLLLLAGVTSAQTTVDRVVERLEFHGRGTIDNWKYAVNPKGDPTRPEYDDSAWDTLRIDQHIYPDSCWIRRVVVLPEKMLGEPVRGKVKFLVSVDDYGYLWVNGESKGYFPWNGEFELTQNAKPGDRFVLAIKALNTGGPLRLLRASIQSEASAALAESINDLALSLRVGQKLLSFDTYQSSARRKVDPKIDRSTLDRGEKQRLNALLQEAAGQINLLALEKGELPLFQSSVAAVREKLKPVGEYAKRFTLFFDANAHIDAAWLWRQGETIEVAKNTFTSVLDMMEARSDFTYTQSAAAYYEWMRTLYPDVFRRIQQRVREGRWGVVGGMWVEPDCNLPSGESWMRHLLYAKRFFQKHLGVDVSIGWNPDSFGYNWNMPQFYSLAGIDAFITQKIGWNETNVFPHRVFWWEAPDGSRILTYFPFDYVNEITSPYSFADWLRQFEANTGFRKMLVLFGVGDHGGGPSNEMLNRIERLKTLDIYPAIEYGTTSSYLRWLRSHDLSSLPVWKDEIYLEYHQGTYTTQAAMKHFNRTSEVLLTNAEKFSALASLYGRPYNNSALEEAWRLTLFNQFHDILPGSSIREVYVDATETHREAQAIGTYELGGALGHLSRQINTAAVRNGTPLVVFNPLSWERTDVVHHSLPVGDESEYAVFDATGTEVPSQIARLSRYQREIMFVADRVPPIGHSTFVLRKQRARVTAGTLRVSSTTLENEFFRITLDADSGWVKSIVDKRHGKEILSGYGNRLQLLEDKPSAWDAWNIGLTGVEFPSKFRRVEVVERGPIRAVLRVYRDYRKPGTSAQFPTQEYPTSFFVQDIILYAGIDRIDFKTDVDWWEEKTMLKVAFPVTVQDTVATYEIPYGAIQRSTRWRDSWDSARVEVPAQRWADLSQDDYGVSLLNRAKYGYDIKGSRIRLSLLRSPKWPDPTADRGKHSIEYSLYPHGGRWNTALTVQRGYEYNSPLLSVTTDSHRGVLPLRYSFLQFDATGSVLTTIKRAEDSDAWVVQWYDATGQAAEATLRFPRKVRKAVQSDLLERDGAPVSVQGNVIKTGTRRNGIATVKVAF